MAYLKMATAQKEAMCILWFLKMESIIKLKIVTELSMGKIHLKITLSNIGYSW